MKSKDFSNINYKAIKYIQLHHGKSNMNCIKITNLETQSPSKVNWN